MKPKYVWIPVTGAVTLVILLFVIPAFTIGKSKLNSLTHYIDIRCGRYRYERYLLWIKVSDRVEETELSRTYRESVGEPPAPMWRVAFAFSPSSSGYSPQYLHSRSVVGTQELTESLMRARFTKETKKTVVVNFLHLLQKYENGSRARDYAVAILELAYEVAGRGNAVIEVEQLPVLPEDDK